MNTLTLISLGLAVTYLAGLLVTLPLTVLLERREELIRYGTTVDIRRWRNALWTASCWPIAAPLNVKYHRQDVRESRRRITATRTATAHLAFTLEETGQAEPAEIIALAEQRIRDLQQEVDDAWAGCCSTCGGSGYSGDTAVPGGRCWDCRATRHMHRRGPCESEARS